jgi:hypothetical protein
MSSLETYSNTTETFRNPASVTGRSFDFVSNQTDFADFERRECQG